MMIWLYLLVRPNILDRENKPCNIHPDKKHICNEVENSLEILGTFHHCQHTKARIIICLDPAPTYAGLYKGHTQILRATNRIITITVDTTRLMESYDDPHQILLEI